MKAKLVMIRSLSLIFIMAIFFGVYSCTAIAGSEVKQVSGAISPQNFIEVTADNIMTIIQSSTSDGLKEQQLTKEFLSVMDTSWIARFVLGRYWQSIDDKQKKQYAMIYEKYLVYSYVPLFKKYNGQNVAILRVEPMPNNEFIVMTNIDNPAANQAIQVEYRLVLIGNQYRVRDIIAEGVSLLQTQRSDFSSIIANSGFDDLLSKLESKAKSNAETLQS